MHFRPVCLFLAALALLPVTGASGLLAGGPPPLSETSPPAEEAPSGADAAPSLPDLQQLVDGKRFTEAQRGAFLLLSRWLGGPEGEVPDVEALLRVLIMTVWNAGGTLTPCDNDAIDALVEQARLGLGERDPRYPRILTRRASLLVYESNYGKAQALFDRALALEQEIPSPPADVADTLAGLVQNARYQGLYSAAIVYIRRAVDLNRSLGPAGEGPLSGALNELAELYRMAGELLEAKAAAEESLRLREKIFGPEGMFTATGLDWLSDIYRDLGDFGKARSLSLRATRIWSKTLGEEDGTYAGGLDGLALALAGLGEREAAAETGARALEIAESVLGPEDRRIHSYAKNLAIVLDKGGDLEGARREYGHALRLEEKTFGESHPSVGDTLSRLSRVEYLLGEPSPAFEHALRAERLIRKQFVDVTHLLSEGQALTYESARTSGFDVAASVVSRPAPPGSPPAPVGDFWNELIQSRALVLDEMAMRQRLLNARDNPEIASLAATLLSVRNRLASLLVRGPSGDSDETYRSRLAELMAERERWETRLAERSERFREHRGESRAGLAEVASALPASGALVAYFRYRQLPDSPPPGSRKHETKGELSYLALMLRPDLKSPVLVPLGPASVLEPLVSEWREQAGRQPPLLAPAHAEAACRAAGERLRRAIWDPVVPHLPGAGRIFIVPDGAVSLINFDALPAEAGDGYLIESERAFHYLSAERDLVRHRPAPAGTGILALGGPDFDGLPDSRLASEGTRAARAGTEPAAQGTAGPAAYRGPSSDSAEFRSMRFEALPGAAGEAAEIGRLWSDRKTGEGDAAGAVALLIGEGADEASFKRLAPGHRIIHLATHGFVLGDSGDPSSAASSRPASDASSSRGALRDPARQSLLLLSGLALAGANHRDSATRCDECEDGILTAEEITSLDLSSVEWAVLSACQTGVGKVISGEGIIGLRRAFEVAGAGTVLMSLWKIEDQSTLDWMRRLYAARLGGASTLEAVRDAGRETLAARRAQGKSTHPFYWGAFVAAGDWR